MATRSFTVFCDFTEEKPTHVAAANVLAVTSPNIRSSSSTNAAASATEKENLHPVTGENCAAPSSPSKKRKTNVLATKVIVSKKSKGELKPATKSKKEAGKRKGTTKKSRRVPALPKLDEESNEGNAAQRLLQSDIDSRCYELTVSPLADVTQAYDPGFDINSALSAFTAEEGPSFRKAASQEPEIRDYFSHNHTSRATTPVMTNETKVFSTPEREHIYSAFTFTTPSPSSDRFREIRRSASPTPSHA
ncbi:hypothetical protein MIND_00141200 [Mycena indigotica]|uniref:Uncharacterized protein n=1 Tax=Mycena indigotica TaxID=2126181 RepID=A0A8H6TGF9_9AGAR|nr:uncharacterized protein MIND_00141200 [Mycena indigotica]KAF7316226.1 hypothetical protein MIND_00141200 [Mycena indigotica]